MRLSILIIAGIALFGMLGMSSCNRYIDVTNGSTPVEQGSFKFYTDSNLFIFKTNITATRDTEKIYPKFFEVTLPKKIKYYEFINSSDFGFYYDKGQVIFIKIELEPNVRNNDTTYSPSAEKLKELIQSDLKTGDNKHDIKKIPFSKNRRNTVFTKGDATILLYNIADDNYSQFLNYVNSFRFIN